MELPADLARRIAEKTEGANREALTRAAREISLRYREMTGQGRRLLTEDMEALAYAAARMPATYAAVRTALGEALGRVSLPEGPLRILDVGAGAGAGAWAAAEVFDVESIRCLERERAMRELGAELAHGGENPALRESQWREFDLVRDEIPSGADVVLISYVLGELAEKDRMRALEKCWNAAGTLLLIVEPGTPVGAAHLRQMREALRKMGAHVAAPCPGEGACPLPETDWCHFTCRVARTRLHKALKGGEAPYEDEKFAYLAVSRDPARPCGARVLRHPVIEPGKITVNFCGRQGIEQRVFRKKDALFKWARKAGAGDCLEEGDATK